MRERREQNMKRRDWKQWERRFIEEEVEGNQSERKKSWKCKGERWKEKGKDRNHWKEREIEGKEREKMEKKGRERGKGMRKDGNDG